MKNSINQVFFKIYKEALIITLDCKLKKKLMYCSENQLLFEI